MSKTHASDSFKQYCQKIIKKHKIPGLAIGLNENGVPLWREGIGLRHVNEQLPVTADTVFGIGSITKSFTCVAIMQLQEEGKLSVNDLVATYLPEFKTPDIHKTNKITIHHLMTNSSGIPPLATLFGGLKKSMEADPDVAETKEEKEKAKKLKEYLADLSPVETKEELLEEISNAEYEFLGEPGEQFSYSNDCFALLGIIIERLSGLTYEQYIKENILEPAGMKNSVFHLYELKNHENVTLLYDALEREGEKVVYESNNPWDSPSMRSAGFLKSTVNDMLKYAEIYRNGGKVGEHQIISNESVEVMMTPHISSTVGRYYGYGLMITPDFYGYKLVEHGGGIKGVAAQLNVIPELNLSGVSLANLASVPSHRLLHSAFNDYIGKDVTDDHLVVKEEEITKESLEEFVSAFKSSEGDQITFSIENNQLQLTMEGKVIPLTFIGNDWFALTLSEEKSTTHFIRNDNGHIVRVLFGFRQLQKVNEED